MADAADNPLVRAAERVLENLAELEPELVSAGIFRDREPVAVTSGADGWSSTAIEVIESVAAASPDEKVDSAHIACAEGEVFVVSDSGLELVAVTGRFVLASLTSYDMRMALRDAASAKATAGAESEVGEDA